MGRNSHSIVGALAVAVAGVVALAQNAPLFQFTEKPGPHLVGLKVVEQYDYSRTYRSRTDPLGAPYERERASDRSACTLRPGCHRRFRSPDSSSR